MLPTTNSTTQFIFADHLGSTRLVTGVNQSVIDAIDFSAFGQLLAGGSGTTHLFTGKERDEASLTDFGARYYRPLIRRFMTADWSEKPTDVPYASLGNPQSLNLYSYVNNNPVTTRDPDGHCFWDGCVLEGAAAYYVGSAIVASAVLATPQGRAAVTNIASGVVDSAHDFGAWIGSKLKSSDTSKTAPAPQSNPAPGTQAGTQPGQKDADFVVTPSGTAVATDPGRVRDSLMNAPGVTTTPANSPSGETGTIQTGVRTPNGLVDVRTMDGSASHGPRTVITHPGTNSPKTPDGKATNDKNDNHIPNEPR